MGNLLNNNIKPAGLGARDSLRLEAGLNLYGTDMDESVTPLESNLAWTIDWHDTARDFIGKEALQKQITEGIKHQLVGIVLLAKNVCRGGMVVYMQDSSQQLHQGKLTSGGYAPSLSCSIGLARIPTGEFTAFEVDIRGKKIPAKMIKLPFVKKGLANFFFELTIGVFMSDIPTELRYTKSHEWAAKDEDELITIGITHHAQKLLGDIVFIELPEVGIQLHSGEEFGVVESVKAASDLYSPLSGEVVEVNAQLATHPGLINQDPYHEGWFIKVRPDDVDEWDDLMDAEEYAENIEAQKE